MELPLATVQQEQQSDRIFANLSSENSKNPVKRIVTTIDI